MNSKNKTVDFPKVADFEWDSLIIIGPYSQVEKIEEELKEIVDLKKDFNFRLLIDDAHGFGTMGKTGAGTHEEQDCIEGVDVYFATFAKSMAGIGAFVASTEEITNYLRYNMRSQTFAKALPMPMVVGLLKRLELLKTKIGNAK